MNPKLFAVSLFAFAGLLARRDFDDIRALAADAIECARAFLEEWADR